MGRKPRLIVVLTVLFIACTSAAPARPRSDARRFPVELLGVWEGGVASCHKPGNLDSNQRIEIARHKLLDYEQWQELIQIAPLSKAPLAWKVRSRLHIDEHSSEVTDIFLISREDKGLLTIVNTNQSTHYRRCL